MTPHNLTIRKGIAFTARTLSVLASRTKRFLVTTLRVLWNAAWAFFNDDAFMRASSLSFTTLISIVPLLTVGLSIMNFYGVSSSTRSEMEAVLAQYLLPSQSRNVIAIVANAAAEVTQNVGALGLLSFCVSLIFMARELEGHVLKICNRKSSLGSSLLHYTAFVVLAPTGVILAFTLLHPLAPVIDHLPLNCSQINFPFLLTELVMVVLLRTFSDYALSWAACASGAVAGGVAAGASWKGCALYFAHSASVSAYGALSFVPAFMVWIFVAWCCMLFGVQVAAKTQGALTGGCMPPCKSNTEATKT
jgi:membrane protein